MLQVLVDSIANRASLVCQVLLYRRPEVKSLEWWISEKLQEASIWTVWKLSGWQSPEKVLILAEDGPTALELILKGLLRYAGEELKIEEI